MTRMREIRMFNIKDKILPLALTPHAKLKKKVLGVSGLLLMLSLLLIDVINARTENHLNWMLVFVKNIPLLLPWGIAYLLTSKYKDLLKLYTPLYLSSMLLIATSFSTFHCFTQAQNFEKKFCKELENIMNHSGDVLDNAESFSQNESLMYSANEYGYFATYLNKIKKMYQLFNQEHRAVVQAFNEVELNKTFTEEILFNYFNLIEKKKKIEQLLLFLDESSRRVEDIYSEYVTWVLSSPEVDEGSRQNFAKAISTASEEKKLLRQEPYRIKKDITQEYINFLGFFSKIYGTYAIDANGQILFASNKDFLVWKSHFEKLENLFAEEENFAQFFEQKIRNMSTLSPLRNEN